jgi:integrase
MNLVLYNAAERVEAPRVPPAERVTLDREHVLGLLAVAEGSPSEAAVVLAALHGLRVGEVLGLVWNDCDLRQGVVHVRRQLVEERRTGKRERVEVKTAAGKREVPLSARAVAALERHRARLGSVLPHPERLVFTDRQGAPLRRSNFHRRVWVPLRNAAKLPAGTRFHDLRHAAASALLGAGRDVATVAGTLGHSGPHVTLRVYAHALPSRKREAAAKVDSLYGA